MNLFITGAEKHKRHTLHFVPTSAQTVMMTRHRQTDENVFARICVSAENIAHELSEDFKETCRKQSVDVHLMDIIVKPIKNGCYTAISLCAKLLILHLLT